MKHGCGAVAARAATVVGKPESPQLVSTFNIYYCPRCDKPFWRRRK